MLFRSLRLGYRVDPDQAGATTHAVNLKLLRVLEQTGCRLAVPVRKVVPLTNA